MFRRLMIVLYVLSTVWFVAMLAFAVVSLSQTSVGLLVVVFGAVPAAVVATLSWITTGRILPPPLGN